MRFFIIHCLKIADNLLYIIVMLCSNLNESICVLAEKRKWSEVEYGDYCCTTDRGHPVCDINSCGKKTFVSGSGCNSSNPNVRCRANGTISAPPVPAVLMVRGSVASGGYSNRCDSFSRSGSSGCSSQHSCYGDDEDAYIVSKKVQP